MQRRRLWIILTLLAVLAVAGMIFFFSSQNKEESDDLGLTIIEPPLTFFKPDYPTMPPVQKQSLLEAVTFVVRKMAHFSEFGLLGFCLMAHLRLVRWERPMRGTGLMAWVIAALYAGTDELHQMFVSGRSPELRDVCIDSAGALCGVLLMAACFAIAKRRKA